MQKKLLAVAVAGALAAPVAAFAQSSGVTIYGTLSFGIESRSATGGDTVASAAAQGASGPISSIRGASTLIPGAFAASGGNTVDNQAGVNGSRLAAVGGSYTATPADLAGRTSTVGSGSNWGLRIREDLGGSMYAWAQIELSIGATAVSPISSASGQLSPGYRNTGLALGSSAWGDVILGLWDTPLNTNMNAAPQHAPYSNASTSFSDQFFGGNPITFGTVSGQEINAACAASTINPGITGTSNANPATVPPTAGTGSNAPITIPTTFASNAQTCLSVGMSFHRRQANTLQYWSPNWSGFQAKVMYGAEQQKNANIAAAAPGGLVSQPSVLTPRMWGGSLTYSAGPLYVGLGYENHKDFTAFAIQSFAASSGFGILALGGAANAAAGVNTSANFRGGTTGASGSNDTAWNINARYTFGAFTVGAYYERLKWGVSYGTEAAGDVLELRKKAWGLEGAFVTGPHTLGVRYARAKNLEGSLSSVCAAATTCTFNGDSSGATGWIFGYGYSLSKRTSVNAYHTRISNDTNARYQGIVFAGLSPAAGGDPRYTGVGLRHTF